MIEIRPSTDRDLPQVIDLWRRAVDATHHFLSREDRVAIEAELSTFLPQVSLTLAVDRSDRPLGFMFLHDGHMEALFIDPDHHGQGIGTALVAEALARHPHLTTDVNEQNAQAVGFYRRIGFECIGRSDTDGQGRPYPLLHLRFR